MESINKNEIVKLVYKNWRGEIATRTVLPKKIYFGTNERHTIPGWIMVVYDLDRNAEREYLMSDILSRDINK